MGMPLFPDSGAGLFAAHFPPIAIRRKYAKLSGVPRLRSGTPSTMNRVIGVSST